MRCVMRESVARAAVGDVDTSCVCVCVYIVLCSNMGVMLFCVSKSPLLLETAGGYWHSNTVHDDE